ncbi:MAG: sigma-70 family RNA polymerase sigma factor, partial [Bryobacteraceae bacterium]
MNRTEQNKTFAAWVESHNAILWKVARSFAPEEDQEDLHQDLLVALWQALPAFRQDSKVSTFVYRVAFNRALT